MKYYTNPNDTNVSNRSLDTSTLSIDTNYDYTDNNTSRTAYNFDGAYLTKVWVENVRDAEGDLVEPRSGNANGLIDEIYTYDWFGNKIKVQDGNGYTTSYKYDKLGRLTKEIHDSDNGSYKLWEYKSDTAENSVTFTDENNTKIVDAEKRCKTKTIYDSLGNESYDSVYKADPATGVFSWVNTKQYIYDALSRLDTEKDLVKNSSTKYTYYLDDRLKSKDTTESDGKRLCKETYTYSVAYLTGKYSKVTKTITGDADKSPEIVQSTYTDENGLLRIQEKKHKLPNTTIVYYIDTFDYDFKGNKIIEKTARAYDECWVVTGTTNALPYTAKYEYDFEGKPVKTTNVYGKIISFAYDETGRKISTTDMKGNAATTKYATTFRYDNMGRLIEEKAPFEGNETTGSVTSYAMKKYFYDRNGNKKAEKVYRNSNAIPEFGYTKYGYDTLNRLNVVKKFEDLVNIPKYSDIDSGYTGKLNFTQYYYDSVGNKQRMYTGLTSFLTISGLDAVKGSDNDYSTTKYDYDGLNRLIKVQDPQSYEESYTYDLNNNLTDKVDKNKNSIKMLYDGLNRLTKKSVSTLDGTGDVSYSFTYALNGNRLSMDDGVTNTLYSYDDLGRLTQESMTKLSLTIKKLYTYDAGDNRKSLIIKSNDTQVLNNSYDYDWLNRLWHVYENGETKPANATATYGYDINGNRQLLTYKNNNSTTYAYNLANVLNTITNKKGTSPISSFTYVNYLDGNISTKSDNVSNKTTTYMYDGMNRLINETESQGTTNLSLVAYTYDDYSNRLSMNYEGSSSFATSYKYDLDCRLKKEVKHTNIDGADTITEYEYDNNGNMFSKSISSLKTSVSTDVVSYEAYVLGDNSNTDFSTYSYDGFNQLKTVNIGRDSISYTYNGDGLRLTKTINDKTTCYVLDGQNVVIEMDGSDNSVKIKYLRGINLIAYDIGTTRQYYLFNGHGDVIQLTDSTGTKVKDYKYDAFGNEVNPVATDTNAFRYCGEYFDKETGTYYLRARYYDPVIGRFITEDSVRGNDIDPLSLNLYTYGQNNPVLYTDPNGHFINLVAAAIGAAVGAVVNVGITAAIDYLDDGSFNKGWQSYAGAAAAGAIGGAAAGFTMGGSLAVQIAANVAVGAATSAAGSVAEQAIVNGSVDAGTVGWSALGGGAGAGIGKGISALWSKGSGAVQNVFRRTGKSGNDSITINQLKRALNKRGMSVKGYDFEYVPEILDYDGLPVFGNSPMFAINQQITRFKSVLGSNGKPLIQLTDKGLSSMKQGVITTFHEIHHIETVAQRGFPSNEKHAEAFGISMFKRFMSRE